MRGLPRLQSRRGERHGLNRDNRVVAGRRDLATDGTGGPRQHSNHAFAVVLFGTHTPAIADGLRPYAAGTFAIEAAWLGAALLLWMPVVGPEGSRRRLSYLAAAAYLFVPFILPKAPGLVFTVVAEPLFEVYRAAPRGGGLSASADQQLGGIVLWSAGTVMVFVSLGVLFARWVREDRRLQAPDSLGVPADPEVLEVLFAEPGACAALQRLVAIIDEELPAEDSGARIEFRVRATAEGPRVAVLELTAGLDAGAEADLTRRIEAGYAAYLERLRAPRRSRVAAVLAFEVAGYGSRVV